MRFAAEMHSGTIFLAQTLDAQGAIQGHRVFSEKYKADQYVANEPLPTGHSIRVIEREGHYHAITAMKARNQ